MQTLTKTPATERVQSLFTRALWSKRLPIAVEALLILFVSFLIFSAHVFASGTPKISLLFDSQQYMYTADGLLRAVASDPHGFMRDSFASLVDPGARERLAALLSPAREILKTGPMLPALLALVYGCLGKTVTTQYWAIAANVMIAVQSATVVLIWLALRRFAGAVPARCGALLAATYPAMIATSGRILSEMPAAFAVALSLYCFPLLARDSRFNRIIAGVLLGLSTACLILARSVFVALPIVFLFCLCIHELGKRTQDFKTAPQTSYFLTFPIAIAVCFLGLIPWMSINYALKGAPTVLIDRNGAYNLWVGTKIDDLGYDVAGTYVSHPERFTQDGNAVLKERLGDISKNPAQFFSMVLQKPTRMFGAPWNDFQNSIFSISFGWQKWWHQVLLMLAVFGFVWQWRNKTSAAALLSLMAAGVVAYHAIYIIFISMTRYLFPAMPAILILAGLGAAAVTSMTWRHRLLFVAACLLPATANSLIETLQPLPSLGGVLVAAVFLASFVVLLRLPGASFNRLALAAIAFTAIAVSACLYAPTVNALSVSNHPLSLRNLLTVEFNVGTEVQSANRAYYLVADLEPTGTDKQSLDVAVKINGKECPGTFVPLMSIDESSREALIYCKSCAYSSGKDVWDTKQWWAMPVSRAVLKLGRNEISLASDKCSIGSDLGVTGKPLHDLDLRAFSWTKGYFTDAPGEMRMDRWNSVAKKDGVYPRLYLLAVNAEGANMNIQSTVYPLGDVTINPRNPVDWRKISPTVPLNRLVNITLETEALASKDSVVSVGLVCTLKGPQGEETTFSPTFPFETKIGANNTSTLKFSDRLPLQSKTLSQVMLIFGGRSWWEMLGYGLYKSNSDFTLKNAKLTIQPIQGINLAAEDWRLERCSPAITGQ